VTEPSARPDPVPSRIAAVGRLARSPVAVRAGTFAGANLLTSAIGGVSTTLLARNLSTGQYGSYSFAASALVFAAMFFEFGLFLPPARQVARGAAGRREVVAAATVAFLPVGAAMAGFVFALSYHVDEWFNVEVATALRLITPFLLVYPYEFVAFQLAQGLDRVSAYSVTRVLVRAGAVATLGAVLLAGHRLTVGTALVVESLSLLVGWTVFTVRLRPVYRGIWPRVRGFLRDARAYGFQVYLGRVLSSGTYSMDTLMVAALTDAHWVAMYALAETMAYLVGLPGAGMAAALFSQMARRRGLPRQWLASAWALGLVAALGACVLARPFLATVIGPAYLPAAALLPPLALAQVVRSVTTLYNTYLTAHARGAQLRNAALLLTATNLVANLCLIPPFGAMGAAWASLLALLVNLGAHRAAYRRLQRAPDEVLV
jgi:O-antigen/teichoic acid export membrane protein